jgi:hypothetical protein
MRSEPPVDQRDREGVNLQYKFQGVNLQYKFHRRALVGASPIRKFSPT